MSPFERLRLLAVLALFVTGCGQETSLPDGAAAGGAASEQGGNGGGGVPSVAGAGAAGAATGGGPAGAGSGGGGAPGGSAGGQAGSGAQPAMSGAGGSQGGEAASGGGDGGTPSKIVLFDGADLSKWQMRTSGSSLWEVAEGAFEVTPGSGDMETQQTFGDFELHVEFWIPTTPATNEEQDRGNSGVYLQGRYEVQILDSYQHPLMGANDCGAVYELEDASRNAALPPENWQTYDITFRAPRFEAGAKVENARVSVIWNGQMVQQNVEVPAPTRLGDAEAEGPARLRLQDHDHRVRYRNIWLREL
jgi:Domain of Unknown Function (DUF1080)